MNIIVYTKTNCGWCAEVLNLLLENGVAFEERNVSDNRDFMEEMTEKSHQTMAPTLDVDGEILADTDADEAAVYLKERGVLN